jgi:multimeric flavodoxin WrbA
VAEGKWGNLMGKKILVIEGSPRKGGNTDLLSDEFIRGAKEAGHDVEKAYLQGMNIHYCVDCEACMKNGGTCVQKDDFAGIAAKLLSCDVLVLASPVYYYSVTAQMKTMIDRCYSILSSLKDKECYFISTAMSETKEYFQTAIDTYHGFICCYPNMTDKGIILGFGTGPKGAIAGNPALEQAYQAGKLV